jgi:glycosyltransferase involved in cell wall biosynthesis
MEVKGCVLMPVYNEAQNVKDAIQSILSQSYPHFDLLVVNDGSTDATEEIVRSFHDSRIQLLRFPKNTGKVSALNWGLAEVDCPYIIRMDADNIASQDRLAKQIEFMEQHPDVGVCGSFVMISNGHKDLRKFPEGHKEIEAHLLFDNPIDHSSAILRTSLFRDKGFRYRDKYEGMEDHDLWLRMKKATHFANIGEPLVEARHHDHRQSVAERKEKAFYFFVETLPQLGIQPTSKDLRLHIELAMPEQVTKFKSPLKHRAWLNRLGAINRQKRIFDQECFERVIEEKWEDLFPFILKQSNNSIAEYLHADGKSRWEIARFIMKKKVKGFLGKR